MGKLKLFIDNILVYGLGGVINKLIPLVMLPIVTRLMPDTRYFGINDLQSTVIVFVSSFAILGLYDALYRMFFEKQEKTYQKGMCTTALSFVLLSSIIAGIIIIILKDVIAIEIFQNVEYDYLCYIIAFTIIADCVKSIVQAPTRMQNQRKVFVITNLITSVFTYSLAIPMIIMGYYVTALPLAGLFSSVITDVIFWKLNHKWFEFRLFSKEYLRELLKIGIPLMPTFVIFWVFNSCDRIMISNYLGVAANGVYAVGAKLAHASQIINTAFGGGWSYFVYSTMNDHNRVEYNSMIFELMSGVIYFSSICIFVIAEPVYQFFFTGDYVSGYIVSPYLFCAPLMQMLFYVASDQLLIIKKSWPITAMLLLGAVVNIALNYILIPYTGIEGAAISTMMGYAISLLVCIIVVQRENLIKISAKCMVLTGEFISFVILWKAFGGDIYMGVASMLIFSTSFAILYREIVKIFMQKLKARKELKNV